MGLLEDAINLGDEEKQAELSTLFREGQATHRALTGDLPGVTWDRRAPMGFTVPRGATLPPETNAALDQLFKLEGRANVEKQMREQELQRQVHTANVIKQIQGVDPQLQAHILSRMGLDNISSNVPAIASKEQQQAATRLAEIKFKHDLEAPDREAKRLDDAKFRNAQLLETITNNRGMAEYRAEMAALAQERNADKRIDRLRTIAGIIQDGQFLAGIDPAIKAQAQKDLFTEALGALHDKSEASTPRPVFRDPGNTHTLAEHGFNPNLVSPGSTSGGESRGPDLSTGIQLDNRVTVRQITPGNATTAPATAPGPVSIVPPPAASNIVPGDRSGWDWTKDPAAMDFARRKAVESGNQLYKNEFGEWIQPGFENSQTRTKVPLRNNPTTGNNRPTPTTKSYQRSARPDRSLYNRHKDRAYEP